MTRRIAADAPTSECRRSLETEFQLSSGGEGISGRSFKHVSREGFRNISFASPPREILFKVGARLARTFWKWLRLPGLPPGLERLKCWR